MKRLSDYKDEAAFDLLADLLEPVAKILADKEMRNLTKKPPIIIAKHVLKKHKTEATTIIKTIDNTVEITPVSVLKAIIDIITDVQNDPSIKNFFRFAEQENGDIVTFGSATESTEVSGK